MRTADAEMQKVPGPRPASAVPHAPFLPFRAASSRPPGRHWGTLAATHSRPRRVPTTTDPAMARFAENGGFPHRGAVCARRAWRAPVPDRWCASACRYTGAAYLGAVRGQPTQVAQRGEQIFRQIQRPDFLVREGGQLDPQFLQRRGFPLAGALAQPLLVGFLGILGFIIDGHIPMLSPGPVESSSEFPNPPARRDVDGPYR